MQYGIFYVDVWKGGYPVWIEVGHEAGRAILKFRHDEIDDLIYALQKAKRQAKAELPDNYKHEVGP